MMSVRKAFATRSEYLSARGVVWKGVSDDIIIDGEPTLLTDPIRGGRGRVRKICLYSSVDPAGAKICGTPIVDFVKESADDMLPLLYTGKRFNPVEVAIFRAECNHAAHAANLFGIASRAVDDDESGNPMQCLINAIGQLPIADKDNYLATL